MAETAGDGDLARRLAREIEGEVLFDAFSRGRYATDASIYQMDPIGVVVARHAADVESAMGLAREAGVPVLPRGGGTSQCGQTVNRALVIDVAKHMNGLVSLDAEGRRATVQPGIVLDQLNDQLKPHGLFFPVDVSTSSRATIGGMAGNNSCGARSIRYGNMVHNVRAIDAILPSGETCHFGEVPGDLAALDNRPEYRELVRGLRHIRAGVEDEMAARWPKLLRRVGGYNLDELGEAGHNMARLLVGSEGTLAFSTEIELALAPLPPHKALGVCHFSTFYQAMDATRHIVELGPAAVELVDRTMIELARDIPAFRDTVDGFVVGEPESILLVEFAGEDAAAQHRDLARLDELMGDLGFAGGMLGITDPAFQREVWEVRKQGLNIMMSMKGEGKPVSFIEDCAVPLEDLADYTDRLTTIFEKHGTRGTWYAHASVGTLHVRPVLNMKDGADVATMRAVAEEAFAMVREYKGSHSGEHGDGIVRSEFHEPMFGRPITAAFEAVKDRFDPAGLMNPGRIVRPPRMDDRSLLRFKPGYRAGVGAEALDWSAWGGFAGAVEMCNNNGACRKLDAAGVMCPSWRVTRDEKDLTRGRANTLRLAISGQLGRHAFTSDEMAESMALCVGCKGCKRECPTGVDMARMKIEYLYHRQKRHGLGPRERLVAALPRLAPWAARLAPVLNLRNRSAPLARLGERLLGLSARRSLPEWRTDPFRDPAPADTAGADVVLLVDTFNRHFEPQVVEAAHRVLAAGGRRVAVARSLDGGRPLCCGRTYLAAGLVEEARAEAARTLAALEPFVAAGVDIVGLEPSCLLTLRDEYTVLLPGAETEALAARARLFEEYVVEAPPPLHAIDAKHALLHGHCHQKAFGAFGAVQRALALVPGLEVEAVASSCCGMAGAFGYEAENYDISMAMGEASLLPAVRAAPADSLVVASGTSCRHQILDGTGRRARHVAQVLADALED